MEKESKEKSQKKSKVFYLNTILSLVAILLLVNTFSPPGHELIKRAFATVIGITSNGNGTLNKLVRFAGATPSTFIGDSIIYDDGTKVGIGLTNPGQKLEVSGAIATSGAVAGVIIYPRDGTGNAFQWFTPNGGTELSLYHNGVYPIKVTDAAVTLVGDIKAADGYFSRSAGTGAIYFGSNGTNYIYNNGSNYSFTLPLSVTGAVTTSERFYFNRGDGGYASVGGSAGNYIFLTAAGGEDIRLMGGNASSTFVTILGATGNVGIGTTVPGTHRLNVNGDFSVDSDGSYAYLQSWNSKPLQVNNQGNNVIFNLTGGNVGIGKTPTYKLDVNGDINFTGTLKQNGTAFGGSSQWTTTGSDIYYNTGKVGIGTTTPGSRFVVSASGADGINIVQDQGTSTNSGRLFFSNATAGQSTSIVNVGGDMRFATAATPGTSSGTPQLTLQNGGNVGIGTAGPTDKLSVTAGAITVGFGNNDKSTLQGGSGFGSLLRLYSGAGTETVRLDAGGGGGTSWITSGNVGIGMTNPGAYKLNVNGTINSGAITSSGNTTMSTNAYTTYGPNTSWASYLRVGGNGYTAENSATMASVVTTNGNLHLDSGGDKAMYLNFYSGTGGINFGNGATGSNANVSAAGVVSAAQFVGGGAGITGVTATNADTVDSQHFAWSNADNNPTYLWGANANGSSFLAARGGMSVNYATTAGSAPANGGTSTLANGVNQYPNRTDDAWYQAVWSNATAGDKNIYSANNVRILSSGYGAIGFNGSAWYIQGNATWGLYSNTGFMAAGGLFDAGSRVCSAGSGCTGIQFSTPNPYIYTSGGSYIVVPGGAYFNSGTVYTEGVIQARGGIHDDTHANLTILGGISGNTTFSGNINAQGRPVDWGNINAGSYAGNTYYAYGRMCVGNNYGTCDGPGGTILTQGSVTSPAFLGGGGAAISLGTSAAGDVLDANTAWGTYLKGSGGVGIGFQAVNGTTAMWISPVGNVGIGFGPVNSGFKLEVNGDGVFRGGIWGSAVGWLSDIRLKKNIQPIVRSIDILSKIDGKSFEWRKEEFPTQNLPSGLRYGMIAQDVEKVLPSVVTTMKDGFKTIDYSEFTPFLIEATKELDTKNTELQTELSDQKIKYSELEARLNKLEKAIKP